MIKFPMALARRARGLKYFATLAVTCMFYLILSVIITFFTNKKLIPSISDKFEAIEPAKFEYNSILSAASLIIGSFENQLRMPFLFEDI